MERIGIRELRQQASRYIDRVEQGETIEVTSRGRLVALLVPAPSSAWDRLVATGQARPRTDHTSVLADGPRDFGVNMTEELLKLRGEEER